MSMELTIVEQPVPFKMEHFDFLNCDLEDYYKYLKELPRSTSEKKVEEFLEQHSNCFILNYSGKDTWKVLSKIIPDDYELLKESSEYECPFTGFKHVSLWPVFILTPNPEDYIRKVYCTEEFDRLPWYADMACDASWNYDKELLSPASHLTRITKSFMGPGYTQMFYPNDGHSDFDLISINLSNGDSIVFLVLKWYNK